MPLTTTVDLSVAGLYTKLLDLQQANANVATRFGLALADGTAANQANRIWADRRTLAASATETLDLAGVLVDAFGDALTFTRIKAIIVSAALANTNNVVMGGAATNAFVGPFGAAAHTVQVRPGGMAVLGCLDATAWPVTAGTGDLLQFANGGAGTPVTYDVILVGTSA